MTRLERKEAELKELYRQKATATRCSDSRWLRKNMPKIDALEKEVIEMRKSGSVRLSEVLKSHDQEMKDAIYKALLKISLAADFVNDCACQTMDILKKMNLNDYSLKADVEELLKISQKLASVVIIPNQTLLTDMITDNSEFIETCDSAANKHLLEKLKLK